MRIDGVTAEYAACFGVQEICTPAVRHFSFGAPRRGNGMTGAGNVASTSKNELNLASGLDYQILFFSECDTGCE